MECCHSPSQQPSHSSLIIPEESKHYPWCTGGLWDKPTPRTTQGGSDPLPQLSMDFFCVCVILVSADRDGGLHAVEK